MSSRASKKDREEFVALMSRELPHMTPEHVQRWCAKIMRLGATHGRLAEALCNGDWPADNGERKTKVCDACGMGWAPDSFRNTMCPDCNCEQKIRALCEPQRVTPVFGGDPRGVTVKIKTPSGKTNDWGHEGICVPTA